jgi:hypothetical protein
MFNLGMSNIWRKKKGLGMNLGSIMIIIIRIALMGDELLYPRDNVFVK